MQMLTDEEIRQVHMASLDVLEQIGISTNSRRIIEVFRRNGADIHPSDGLIKIPSNLVENAVKTAPKEIHLYR